MGPALHGNGKSLPIWSMLCPLTVPQEDEFTVYEPYCANYTNASEIMLAEEQNLMVRDIDLMSPIWSHRPRQNHNHLINAKSELPAFLIKPIQRICKYPLLLQVGYYTFHGITN